jgi:hypothetical protein
MNKIVEIIDLIKIYAQRGDIKAVEILTAELHSLIKKYKKNGK